jgi:Holliday junction DNA helicase RuvA
LKDKIKGIGSSSGTAVLPATADNDVMEGAVAALVMLGFPSTAANKAVQSIMKSEPGMTIEQVIKQALKLL